MQPNLAKLFCEWSTLWLHHKILKRKPWPHSQGSVVKVWWTKGGYRGFEKCFSSLRIWWRIHKQSMENLTQQRSFTCAEHYTHGGLHTGIYGIWNVLQAAGVYTLTTFHTIPYWWATTFLTWSEGIALEQWSFPIVCIPSHIGCNHQIQAWFSCMEEGQQLRTEKCVFWTFQLNAQLNG
jgi:hypothetical protein